MLDHERMHTQLKKLARNMKDLLASVASNYRLLEMAMTSRKGPDEVAHDTAIAPRRSTPAGFETRPDSSKRADGELQIRPLGVAKTARLSQADFELVQHLWRVADADYEALWCRMESYNRRAKVADRVERIEDLPSTQRHQHSAKDRSMITMSPIVKVR